MEKPDSVLLQPVEDNIEEIFSENTIDGKKNSIEICPKIFNPTIFHNELNFLQKELPSQKNELPLLIDKEFPITNLSIKPSKFDNYTRIYDFAFSVFFFYFVTSLKYYIVQKFELATFCDLRKWDSFDKNVENKKIIMFENVNCVDKCSQIKNVFFTKLFESNYYLFYCVNVYFALRFSIKNKLNKKILIIISLLTIINHIIGHAIFFNNKSMAFMIGNFLHVFEAFLILKQSFIYFKMYTGCFVLVGYFSFVKFFFDTIFAYLISTDPTKTLQTMPIILFIIRNIGTLIFDYPILKRYDSETITILMSFFNIFEYLYIGSLHTLINRKGFGQTFWISIVQNFIMELLDKYSVFKRLFILLKNMLFKRKKNKKIFLPNEIKNIYRGIKRDMEFYSILIYLLIICTHYYDYCMTDLVDCMGRPLVSLSPIKSSHFLLVLILLFQCFLDEIVCKILNKIFRNKLIIIRNVNFRNFEERIWYIFMMFGVTINFGLSGIYSMMML